MAGPEHSESAALVIVINKSSGVFPSPTRLWPGMTQAMTGKVSSSWETAQGARSSEVGGRHSSIAVLTLSLLLCDFRQVP